MTITERDGTGKITRQTGRVEAPGALAATWGSAPPPKPAPSGFAIDPKEADILRIAAERRNAMLDEHLGSFMVNEELKRVVPPEQYEPLSDEQRAAVEAIAATFSAEAVKAAEEAWDAEIQRDQEARRAERDRDVREAAATGRELGPGRLVVYKPFPPRPQLHYIELHPKVREVRPDFERATPDQLKTLLRLDDRWTGLDLSGVTWSPGRPVRGGA